jgi:hypothetical protein
MPTHSLDLCECLRDLFPAIVITLAALRF